MQEIDELIDTCEILREAVFAKDNEEGLKAVTFLLVQFIKIFGHDRSFMAKIYPMLEGLKNQIQSGEFDEVVPVVLAFLSWLRQTSEHIRNSSS